MNFSNSCLFVFSLFFVWFKFRNQRIYIHFENTKYKIPHQNILKTVANTCEKILRKFEHDFNYTNLASIMTVENCPSQLKSQIISDLSTLKMIFFFFG